MTRSCGLIALFLIATCWMTALAQGGGGDPDAKGTITITVEVKNGVTTITATRGSSTGWDLGGVGAYAISSDGGLLYFEPILFAGKIGDPNPKTDSVVMPLPNGTFDVWATHTVTKTNAPAEKLTVGSALSSATVTNSIHQVITEGGSITCVPVRVSGGAGFQASGKWSVFKDWKKDPDNAWIYFDTIPTGGGLVRRIGVYGIADGTWKTDPSTLYVQSQLNYNCWSSHAIVGTKGQGTQVIGSVWVKNK